MNPHVESTSEVGLEIEQRPSESPYVERVWRSRSFDTAHMLSVAGSHWGLAFWRRQGEYGAAITGPETIASHALLPQDATFFGIDFAFGTFLPHLPAHLIVERQVDIPEPSDRSFHLAGSHWHYPGFDNAEAFVHRLVREEIVLRDRMVTEVARGAVPDLSVRAVQRRFRAVTGITQGAARQIERARSAAVLLRGGVPPADVITELGYYDNPHLHRTLRRFIGRTATELSAGGDEPLSLLYTT